MRIGAFFMEVVRRIETFVYRGPKIINLDLVKES